MSEMRSSAMPTTSFKECWAKIERAKKHRDDLERHIRETFSKFPVPPNLPGVGVKFETHPIPGQYVHCVFYISTMPDLGSFFTEVGLILGDAIHNLRSALNYLVFRLAGAKSTKVQFPICDGAAKFAHAKRKQLAGIHPDHVAIIEGFQPYHGVQEQLTGCPAFHGLALLQCLSNTDKHCLLNTVMFSAIPHDVFSSFAASAGATIVGMPWMDWMEGKVNQATPIELGTELGRIFLQVGPAFPSLQKAEMEVAGYITPPIAFPDGWPVVTVVDKIAAVVVKIIRKFDPVP